MRKSRPHVRGAHRTHGKYRTETKYIGYYPIFGGRQSTSMIKTKEHLFEQCFKPCRISSLCSKSLVYHFPLSSPRSNVKHSLGVVYEVPKEEQSKTALVGQPDKAPGPASAKAGTFLRWNENKPCQENKTLVSFIYQIQRLFER